MPGPGSWIAGDVLIAADLNAIGTWTAFTPAVLQGSTLTSTANYAKYCLINKLCIVNADINIGSAGTAGQEIRCQLPLAGATVARVYGSGFFYDVSATLTILLSTTRTASNYVTFFSGTGTLGSTHAVTAANGDNLSLTVVYEID
jgi:hypothetical protein